MAIPNISPQSQSPQQNQFTRTIEAEVLRRRNVWNLAKFAWWIGHYILGSLATLLPIVDALTTPAGEHSTVLHLWLDIGGAICAGLLTFLIPSRAGKAYGAAWRRLDYAIIAYKIDPNVSGDDILKALKEGESLIEENEMG